MQLVFFKLNNLLVNNQLELIYFKLLLHKLFYHTKMCYLPFFSNLLLISHHIIFILDIAKLCLSKYYKIFKSNILYKVDSPNKYFPSFDPTKHVNS